MPSRLILTITPVLTTLRNWKAFSEGNGQYRIRAGRFRFRYDAEEQVVYLKTCALRREGTYN